MKFRVAEIFGPTIQGEGRHIGSPCYFIRFGGCDFRCSWCDSPHAVLPEMVAQLPRMDETEIIASILELKQAAKWVVFSGGNPALLDLANLNRTLRTMGYVTMIETQGSIYRPWLQDVDEVCLSPKPPSSGMDTDLDYLDHILAHIGVDHSYLKVVVFNDEDYEWAIKVHQRFHGVEFFLSVGNEDPQLPTVSNPTPHPMAEHTWLTREVVIDQMRWLMEKVANDPRAAFVRVLPQLHVLAWGNERGR